jgi:hypothetical protein
MLSTDHGAREGVPRVAIFLQKQTRTYSHINNPSGKIKINIKNTL